MRVGSLFSGIGGLDLGLERAGMRVIWQSEIDPYACKVLAKHWPDVPNLGDVTKIEWSNVERPDIVCGGYPCQPFSSAGDMRGDEDERFLWPWFADALRELRPDFALLENVPGHLVLGFDRVLADLAALGFDAEWSIVSACALGAPHTRERLFVVAHATRLGLGGRWDCLRQSRTSFGEPEGPSAPAHWAAVPAPEPFGMAHGVRTDVDRQRLHVNGNAVVPQVAELVGRAIVRLAA